MRSARRIANSLRMDMPRLAPASSLEMLLWLTFGDRAARDRRSLAISGTKSMTGHMMGAAGAFEAFASVMTVAEQTVPGTLNYRDFDPACDVWVVDETIRMPVRYALSNNIGLGGHNGAVIFKRYDGD